MQNPNAMASGENKKILWGGGDDSTQSEKAQEVNVGEGRLCECDNLIFKGKI